MSDWKELKVDPDVLAANDPHHSINDIVYDVLLDQLDLDDNKFVESVSYEIKIYYTTGDT